MKRIIPLSIIVLIMFIATACGSPTPAATQAPAQPAATEAPATDDPSAQPAATEMAPTESATLETAPAGNGTQVEIILADNTIDASQTEFQVGVPYTFVITNTGRRAHNFNINPPVSVTGSLDAALDSALLVVPQEQLNPGESATVEFTFPNSAAGQLLEFSCLIRKHYDDGMKVDIIVTN